MKSYIVLLLIYTLGLNFAVSQEIQTSSLVPVDEETKMIVYQEVVEVEGSKKDLFIRCIDWVNNFYKNPVSVTKVRNFESGKIKGSHQFRITDEEDGYTRNAGTVMYSFLIELKDGRYRYTITDFVEKKVSRFPAENWLDNSHPDYNPQWVNYLKQMNSYTENLISELKEKMQPEVKEEDDDW